MIQSTVLSIGPHCHLDGDQTSKDSALLTMGKISSSSSKQESNSSVGLLPDLPNIIKW